MEVNKQTAKRLFSESPEWFQEQLVNEFGKECFIPNDYERIKTPQDACESLGVKMEDVYNEKDTPDEVAYKLLKKVVEAVHTDSTTKKLWHPDWNNNDQRKWFPVFNLSSGFGFSGSACLYAFSATCVGSRLCFESEEKAVYVATQFIDLYKQLLTI